MARLKYVERKKARGHTYLYFRYEGQRWPLPADETGPQFHEAYAQRLRAIESDPAPRVFEAGTVGALMAEFKASTEFLGLAVKTQADYARMLDRLEPVAADAADQIRRAHVRELAKPLAKTPRTHKLFTQVVSRLFSFGIDNDYCTTNPASRMKRIGRAEAHLSWTDDVCTAFEASKPPEWMLRAYMLGRYAGQRLGDVLGMTWRAYDGTGIEVLQNKTSKRESAGTIWIYSHKRLREHLDAASHDGLLMVLRDGKPVKATTASKYVATWLDDIGLGDYTFHGLRHRAGNEMAEAGCTPHMIQKVLGHATLQMTERYTSRASQKRLATAAIRKLEQKGRG